MEYLMQIDLNKFVPFYRDTLLKPEVLDIYEIGKIYYESSFFDASYKFGGFDNASELKQGAPKWSALFILFCAKPPTAVPCPAFSLPLPRLYLRPFASKPEQQK